MIATGAFTVAGAVLIFVHHGGVQQDRVVPETTAEVPVAEKPVAAVKEIRKPIPPAPAPVSRSVQRTVTRPKPEKKPAPVSRKAAVQASAEQQRAARIKYWKRAEERFNSQWDQLDLAIDPEQRDRLINQMAQYVRMDTLGTIEWAMGLQDPEERRLAMEAINKYALSGIGARIQVDNTGFPRIEETTALSAVASTGMVEPGDYIVGMVNAEGQTIDFQNLPIHQIIQKLRGEPGSELMLLMERTGDANLGEPYVFDVPVQRSLLVIQPPN